jgi:ADP-ribosylglycohydrolase
MTTHNDNAAISSCVAFVALLWDLLRMDKPPAADWWMERFSRVARELDDGALYEARGGTYKDEAAPFAAYLDRVLTDASTKDLSSLDACEAFYSGAYLLETVPCVLYILQKHGHDPEEALVRAVNDTRDNDTVGAIVGAAVGALHGRSKLPQRWLDGLTGRTGSSNDGRMFEIIDLAESQFLRG